MAISLQSGPVMDGRRRRWLVLSVLSIVVVCMFWRPDLVHAANRFDETHPNLAWVGSWTQIADPGSYGGTSMVSLTAGSAMTFAFHGTSLNLIGRRAPNAGSAAISVDGVQQTVVNLSGPEESQAVFWGVVGMQDAYHQVTVTALTTVDASGVGGVAVDAFDTDGAIDPVYTRTPFDYPWGTYIVIDKSDYRLYWVRDGWLVKAYPIAHGRKKGWTPNRVWRIGQKYKTAPRGIYGPRKMRLYKQVTTRRSTKWVRTAYGIHGTNQPWVIGTMASHGCIRMYNADILELWPQVPLGTTVVTRD